MSYQNLRFLAGVIKIALVDQLGPITVRGTDFYNKLASHPGFAQFILVNF